MPEPTAPATKDASQIAPSQTLIDEVTSPQFEETIDEVLQPRSFPKVTIASFYNRRHLKRIVKLAFAGYVLVVIVPLLYMTYQAWQSNRDLIRSWEQREVQYVRPLVEIDIAQYNKEKEGILSGFQKTKDPVYAMYALGELANMSGVLLRNPQYSLNSNPGAVGEQPRGVEMQAIVLGNGTELVRFLEVLGSFKPLITITNLRITPSSVEESGIFQASIGVMVALATEIPDDALTAADKIAVQEPIPYPITNSKSIIDHLAGLQTIPFNGLGQSVIGKNNLFGLE